MLRLLQGITMKANPLLAFTGVLVVLVVALASTLGLWSHWTASAQDTFIVNDDTIPTADGCGAPDFQTEDIEDAIDSDLVGGGDTLMICEGTYSPPDAIEVTKSLTIEGRAAAGRSDIVVQGSSGHHGFVVWADDVKIRHLKLAGPPGATGPDDGIRLEFPDSATHERAELSDLDIGGWNAGVLISGSDDVDIGPDNYIHGNSDGVAIIDGTADSSEGNRVFENLIGPNQHGIDLPQTGETHIQNNTMLGNTIGPQILLTGESTAFIWNNDIEATANYGVALNLTSSDALVQIGGSPDHANTFTGNLTASYWDYVHLECESEGTVDATYNYWNGISSIAGISAVVFNDEYDDPSSPLADCPENDEGAVVVHPWLARTVDLSPPGWHDLSWSGADATDPANALACISGKYSIAYAWEEPDSGFTRYVEGCAVPGMCSMGALDEYDSLFVLITSAGATCQMPVAPKPVSEPQGEDGPPDVEPPPPAVLTTAAGEQTSGVYNYCWGGLCVDMLGVLVPTDALVARVDEPLTFELAIEPTQLELLVWPLEAGTVVKGYEGFFAWRDQGETDLAYHLPVQSSFQFTPGLTLGQYVIVLAVRASDGDVGYAFQVQVVP
jgi:hypothetical protein